MTAPCTYEYPRMPYLTEKTVSAPTFPRQPERAVLTQPQLLAPKVEVPLAQRVMTIQLLGEKPAWFDTTVQTMQRLSWLPENWSSYGSCRIEEDSIESAAAFLGRALGPRGMAPTVVPTLQGGVQLEWHRTGDDVEIE